MKIYHTKTQEEYNYLMQQLESEGCKWANGETPLESNYWNRYEKEMCVKEDKGELTCAETFFLQKKYPYIKIQSVVIPDNKGDEKMSKQELMARFREIHNQYVGSGKYADKVLYEVKELLENLEEPKKVVLPKDVAKWFESMSEHLGVFGILENFVDRWRNVDDFAINYAENYCGGVVNAIDNIARAYLNGYEVEKEKIYTREKLYTVVLPGIKKDDNSYRVTFLSKTDNHGISLDCGEFKISDRTKLTEAEIKSLDGRYMVFAVEVKE